MLSSKEVSISCLQQKPKQFKKDKEKDIKMLRSCFGRAFSISIWRDLVFWYCIWQYTVTGIPLRLSRRELKILSYVLHQHQKKIGVKRYYFI